MRMSQVVVAAVRMLGEDNGAILDCSVGRQGPIWLDQADDARGSDALRNG